MWWEVVVEVTVWVVMICGHVSQRDLSQGEVPRFCGWRDILDLTRWFFRFWFRLKVSITLALNGGLTLSRRKRELETLEETVWCCRSNVTIRGDVSLLWVWLTVSTRLFCQSGWLLFWRQSIVSWGIFWTPWPGSSRLYGWKSLFWGYKLGGLSRTDYREWPSSDVWGGRTCNANIGTCLWVYGRGWLLAGQRRWFSR